jgi:hypothetical protein
MKPFVKYGLIATGLGTAWTLLGYLLGNETQDSLKWLSNIILISITVLCFRGAILEVRNAQGGFISFKNAFGICFKTGLVMAVLGTAFNFIYFNYINPEFVNFTIEQAQQKLVEQGMSDEQIEMAINMQRKFMSPAWMMVWSFVGSIIFSIIIGLIMSAIMKRDNPEEAFSN